MDWTKSQSHQTCSQCSGVVLSARRLCGQRLSSRRHLLLMRLHPDGANAVHVSEEAPALFPPPRGWCYLQ
ncbi:hypothetical protein PIB30_020908 [Stylosanthes scabra]|uniref:Uncharacterized protein n=1 Tax=Stylosanthes scabra TaxID=79078 RepID=A0ABU6Y5W7_9FABA|nr:hypothetical protein [Stylosanthes scabra]